jgi:hypothetical protein
MRNALSTFFLQPHLSFRDCGGFFLRHRFVVGCGVGQRRAGGIDNRLKELD